MLMQQDNTPAPPSTEYRPNEIPFLNSVIYGIGAAVVFFYGLYGVAVDDLFLPGKRGAGMHLHGASAWLAFFAMACMAANFVSMIADHFDRRNNERSYRLFAKLTAYLGWTCFLLSLALAVYLDSFGGS